jgi:hypothetical protein
MSARPLVTLFAISLLALTACSREKSDWRSAQAADSTESYEQFISAHPESPLVADARERVQQLTEEKDWRAAASVDTLAGYQQFIAQYPSGKWAKEAQVRIENFAAPTATPATQAGATAGSALGEAPATGEDAASGTAVPPSTGFGVQLGAFSSAERANAEWTRLQADAKGLLDGLAPRVVVGEASGKPIYRLQSEVRDEVQARAVCGGLKQSGKNCVVVLPR